MTLHNDKRVAILAAGSVSGEMGGAERFYGGLNTALLEAGCDSELLIVPTDESNFESILRSYEFCREMDLLEYDLVISTKAPTFVAAHPNHL